MKENSRDIEENGEREENGDDEDDDDMSQCDDDDDGGEVADNHIFNNFEENSRDDDTTPKVTLSIAQLERYHNDGTIDKLIKDCKAKSFYEKVTRPK